MPRYRFDDFVLSPRRRVLVRAGVEQPLIPRYFDLLVFLVEHRAEAVHRRDIFDRVWSDVVVSDSALSQAVRTIRRALGDDSREPRFVRTVSRHGYRFVFAEVVEEDDDGEWRPAPGPVAPAAAAPDPFEPLVARLTSERTGHADRIEAAERLHALGTAETLRRLGNRPGRAAARAYLRAARWDVPGAERVPILGQPDAFDTAVRLVRLRLRSAARLVALRWAGASIGGATAGLAGGALGGLLLLVSPGSTAPDSIVAVLAAIGAMTGGIGGAGVGAGLAVAEASTRSRRTAALVIGGALGGGVVGWTVEWLTRWSLSTLVGLIAPVGGGVEGLALGAAAGLGYALATRHAEGLAAPRGARRVRVALWTAAACALAGLLLTAAGRPLVGRTIHAIAQASRGSRAALTPIARLLGQPDFGGLTRALIAVGEAATFGFGLALGLTRRPRA